GQDQPQPGADHGVIVHEQHAVRAAVSGHAAILGAGTDDGGAGPAPPRSRLGLHMPAGPAMLSSRHHDQPVAARRGLIFFLGDSWSSTTSPGYRWTSRSTGSWNMASRSKTKLGPPA